AIGKKSHCIGAAICFEEFDRTVFRTLGISLVSHQADLTLEGFVEQITGQFQPHPGIRFGIVFIVDKPVQQTERFIVFAGPVICYPKSINENLRGFVCQRPDFAGCIWNRSYLAVSEKSILLSDNRMCKCEELYYQIGTGSGYPVLLTTKLVIR